MFLQASGLVDLLPQQEPALKKGQSPLQAQLNTPVGGRVVVDIPATAGRLRQAYPERRDEIMTILHHMDPAFTPAPPLVVYGPSGCGKTHVVRACQWALGLPHCYFDCDGFSNTRQLVRALFLRVSQALFPGLFRAAVGKGGGAKEEEEEEEEEGDGDSDLGSGNEKALVAMPHVSDGGDAKLQLQLPRVRKLQRRVRAAVRLPTNFSDLCDQLTALLKAFCPATDGASEGEHAHVCIMLDGVTAADTVEPGLAERLLLLSSLAHPGCKMVGAVRHYQRVPAYVLPLSFQAYADDELKKLVVRMVRTAVPSLPLNGHRKDTQLKPRGLGTDKRDATDTTQHAIPRLLLMTRHPTELWVASYQLHRDRLEFERTVATGKDPRAEWLQRRLAEAVGTLFHQPSLLYSLALAIPSRAAKGTAGATAATRGQTAARLGLHAKGLDANMRGHAWCDGLSRSTKYLILASFIASKNKGDTDFDILGAGCKGKRKRRVAAAGKEEERREDAANRSAGRPFLLDRMFCIFMTIAARSGSGPVIDEGAATSERRGKAASKTTSSSRARGPSTPATTASTASATAYPGPEVDGSSTVIGSAADTAGEHDQGTDVDSDGEGQGDASSDEWEDREIVAVDPLRGRIARDYGDAQLFSTVTSLSNMGFLAAAPGHSVNNPAYVCSFDQDFAVTIAKDLQFSLQDYLA